MERSEFSCAICTEDIDVELGHMMRLRCGHYFHGDCIVPWIRQAATCPLCRCRLPLVDELAARPSPVTGNEQPPADDVPAADIVRHRTFWDRVRHWVRRPRQGHRDHRQHQHRRSSVTMQLYYAQSFPIF